MRILFSFLISLLISSIAVSDLTTPPKSIENQFSRFVNYIKNGGAENGEDGWTESAGSLTTSTTSGEYRSGKRGFVFDASAASQTVLSDAVTLPVGNNVAICYLKTTATDYKMQVYDGSNVVVESTIPALSVHTKLSLNFVVTAAASYQIRFISASNAAALYFDDCHLGEADNVGGSLFASTPISYTPTFSNLGTGSVNITYFNYTRRGKHIRLDFRVAKDASAGTGVGNVKFSLPSGIVPDLTTSGTVGVIQGGSTSNSMHTLYWSSSDTSNLYFIQNDGSYFIGSEFAANYEVSGFAEFPVVGWDEQSAFRPDVIAWRVDANIGGANPSLGTSAVTSYTGIENASLDMVQNTGSLDVQIPCSSTNASSGLTCSAGSESVGVVFNLPKAGSVLACASTSHGTSLDANDALNAAFQIVETPNNAQTISQEGKTRFTSYMVSSSAAIDQQKPMRVCGTFYFSSAGQKTLRLMYEQSVTNTPNYSFLVADRDSTTGQRDIHWEVYPIDQQIPAPLLIGSVTSNSSGLERIERVSVNTTCTASPCTITSQSGSWVSSITRNSEGVYTLNIASGIFSAAPTCTAQAYLGTDSPSIVSDGNVAPTTSAFKFNCVQRTATSTVDDCAFGVVCMGPK